MSFKYAKQSPKFTIYNEVHEFILENKNAIKVDKTIINKFISNNINYYFKK